MTYFNHNGMNLEIHEDCVKVLYVIQYGKPSGFVKMLFMLLNGSDRENKEKLRKSFPVFVNAFELWQAMGDVLFKEYGLLTGVKS